MKYMERVIFGDMLEKKLFGGVYIGLRRPCLMVRITNKLILYWQIYSLSIFHVLYIMATSFRVSTMGLSIVLAIFYSQYSFIVQMVCVLDISSHWVQMYW